MNNEDKILEILSSLQSQMGGMSNKMDDMSTRIDTMGNRIDEMGNRMDDMSNKVDGLSDQITKVELHLENVTDKNIGLLMEQYIPNVERLDDVINKVDEIQFDLGGIKRVVISHSKDINELIKR